LGLVLIGIVAGKKPGLGVGLALGGALSNLVTFSITGHAVDYLRFGSVVTNLADILIIVGLGWHALTLVYQKSLPEEAPKRKWYQ
jgi:lipoprotein signal peptidase